MTERRPWIETITDDLLPAPGVLRQMSECYDTTADQLPAVRQLAARVAALEAAELMSEYRERRAQHARWVRETS